MVFYNYYLAVTTDPGKIPPNWEPPSSLVLPAEKEGVTGLRYCKTCHAYKPPRSHHCRYCRVRSIMNSIRHFQFDAEPSTFDIILMIMNFVLVFVVLFAVGILSGYQFYCLLRNQSNIEAWERGKVETLVRRGKIQPIKYPFDIGIYKNICQVLGPKPILWLWPQSASGDGLTFPVIPQTDPSVPYYWPPRDPDDLRPSIFSSKYKRQQEKKRALEENPDAYVDSESEGYYDSGSFISDYDEEEGMTHLIHHRLYDISGAYYNESSSEEDHIPLSNYAKKKK
ncbi:hypothetical protein G6F57_007894 [Rhizopus arrhizus]|uniref:Protein S-acyltransferase n=1 Tax=Rhizopus oryzae TaxID=64495 RepID=A0A9P7BSZ7_RHIOR|nr:hypothetical protein G6F23_003164 [Rhizopus arrhizus]KAG1419607.1 hypothetical protein G6F58_004529 [Rhizopus delemar]KAG0760818.1 hypothetical protein G6F24_008035 [Rhizopus arrhizus]KAG0787829.1 hypothetical protein G6F21_007640 [Rhizopus arrhizus]KAG0799441.1 hypothetical protein G6F22_003227 [Rhizopus arrhizus]